MAGRGDAGIVVLVPDAEPVVAGWRLRHDPPAAQGMPAHVTLLYPFLPEHRHDDALLAQLRAICAPSAPIDLTFRRTDRFPETIYLAPEPAEPFVRLTAAIAAAWPEAPPYGGAYTEVTPHLTIGDGITADLMDEIDADVAPRLPLRARITGAHLFVFDGARWQPREELAFEG